MPTSPMVTSSPGYAIFNDLRRSMGTSSSQLMSTPSRGASALTKASLSPESKPQSSPNMDDVAASQQLINEGARANPTLSANQKLSQFVGAHDKPASARKKRKKHKAKATQKSPKTFANRPGASVTDEAPTSSPFPFPATQPEAEEITRTPSGHLRVLPVLSQPSHAVEVPDSQIAATPMGAPTSPPKSSHVVPSSATKSKKTYKKSRQAKRDKIIQDALMGETVDEFADTNVGTQDQTSPSRATAPHKRQRVGDTDAEFPDTAVDVTPIAAKRRKIGTPKSATTVQDLIHTSSNDDEYPQQGSKTKLKRIKKPHTPIATPKNIYAIPDDESDPVDGTGEDLPSSAANVFMHSGNGGEIDDLHETPILKKRSTERKKRKSGGDVYNWPASVRKPGQSPSSETPKNGHHNGELMDDPISSDDGDPPYPPPEDSRSEKRARKKETEEDKEKRTPHKEARSEDGRVTKHRRSIGSSMNQTSSAERALNTVRDLGHPPDLRTSGDYTEDEEELIRRAIKDYQQRRGLEISELVEIIQWNQYDPRFHREPGVSRNKSDWTPQDREDMQESTEFWDEIKSIGLRRSHERVRRHIRQLYHQFKSGAWTKEDDEQLRNLQAAYPNQWKLISISMGDRSMFDCVNRWRDYLQYGDSRKTSRWSKDEEDLLVRAVTTVVQRDENHRAEIGRPPLDVYTNKDINWPQVAREMGNSRSRIQASVKWVQMMRRRDPPQIEIEYKSRTSATSQGDISTPGKRGRSQKKDTSNKSDDQGSRRSRKSQRDVESSDEEEEPEEQIWDGTEPARGLAASKKHRQLRDSDDGPQDQAHANNEPTNSPLQKKKRGRPRKSEGTGPNKPQKRHKSSPARDSSENREAEEEYAKDEASDEYANNKKTKQVKEGAEESKRKDFDESEERESQTSREDVEEGPEKHEDDALSGEAEEGQEQEEDEQEQEQVDEAMEDEALSDEGQEDETHNEARVDEAQENEAQSGAPESSDATPDTRHDEAGVEGQLSVESEAGSATPHPEEHHVPEDSAEPGVDQMLWGDKYDLIFKLQDRRDDYEDDIDWEDVRKDQAYPWSVETLKAALGQLIQHLRDDDREVDADDFPGTIDDVMDFISEKHPEQLEEHYSAP